MTPTGGAATICAFGDALVDVVTRLSRPLALDDDVPAVTSMRPGGQAANVASWAAWLGAPAVVLAPVGEDAAGAWLRSRLAARGIPLHPRRRPPGARTGTVVALIGDGGRRTMASDRGGPALEPADLDPAWFEGCRWLHLSGYALFGSGSAAALAAASLAVAAGAAVSVDVSSSTLVAASGPARCRARISACGAALVLANQAEHEALGPVPVPVVVKRGAEGALIVEPGQPPAPVPPRDATTVRDTTGAGDAFAAGWLVGGADVAADAAAQCVAMDGAAPPDRR